MRKFIEAYYQLLSWLLVITVAILIIPVSIQIFSRFTALIPAWIWTEEMARFFFIWMVMIGAMVGIRDGGHFDVDLWPELKPRANALLRIVTNVFVLVFALVFIWYGIKFVQFGWDQTSELAELPMTYIFFAWPMAGFTWVLFLGERFVADLRTFARGESIDVGLDRLAHHARELARLPATEMATSLVDVLLRDGETDDDIAVLVVRNLGSSSGGSVL
jgi:TRAP-type C4-dicarboxylate transport system permease small subunit